MAVASEAEEKNETQYSMESSPPSPSPSNPKVNPETSSDADLETSSVSTLAIPEAGGSSDIRKQSDLSFSQRKEAEIQSQFAMRSEEYRLLFHLPPEEVLVQDFNCALQENIPLQGHMYLFVHHICFYSNIFGFETKKTIPFNEVACVRKAKTAAIFPNAIEIFAGDKKYFFTSFFFRDEAYRLILDGWSQHNACSQALVDRQESKSDTSSPENGLVLIEKPKSLKHPPNDFSCVDRDSDAYVSTEGNHSSNIEDDVGVPVTLSELHDNGGEGSAEWSSRGESLLWKVEDSDAPKIPEYYTTIAESKFPIRVVEFFNLFFSDAAVNFTAAFHRRCRDKDFHCTPWNEHQQFGYTREVSFQHPIKLYFGARFGHCREVQKFRVYKNSHLIIEKSQEINDVPYGDYFLVEGLWDVEEDDNGCCILRMHVNVAFSRKTIWKGKIEQSTMDECREAYAIWISSAHELVKKENIAKSEGIESDAANLVQNNVGLGSSAETDGLSESTRVHKVAPQGVSIPGGVNPQPEKPVEGGLSSVTSILSLFRELWASFCLYLKNQCHFPVMVVLAFVSILILMQLSIIVLLTRTPEVHLISQDNFMSTLVTDRTEVVAWFDRHVCHLKDEMMMVETRLENMRYEYILLKKHLQSLEKLDPKS